MQDLTHATVANPGELPPDTVCDSGWFFEIYHPRIDYPDIQAIEVHVACTQPTLEDACEHVADLAGFLMSTHLMAGNVDGQMPGIGWTPYGPVTTSERQPIRIEHLGRSVERPAIAKTAKLRRASSSAPQRARASTRKSAIESSSARAPWAAKRVEAFSKARAASS